MGLRAVFRSAVDDGQGQVDAGYFAIAVAGAIVLGAVPVMVATSLVVAVLSSDHRFDPQALGIGIGGVCTGFATVCGAVGAFRWGDRDRNVAR